jgi:hypothetical protein
MSFHVSSDFIYCVEIGMEDQFQDIRPYHDNEVKPTLLRLLDDDECIDLVTRASLPRLFSICPNATKLLLRVYLKFKIRNFNSVQPLQLLVGKYMQKLINTLIDEFSCSGIEQLKRDKAYLFLSNHRDIVLDSALLNYTLFTSGFDTMRIAAGDNLLKKPFISDLMRLNKTFIVKRNISRPRELFASLKKLSTYIRFSIEQDNQSVWLAHREGRSKDGNDQTDAAILKMLAMSAPKKDGIEHALHTLNIAIAVISYEYDPCDINKARELYLLETQGEYTKDENEDENSIILGIKGYKGNVHINVIQNPVVSSDDTQKIAQDFNKVIAQAYVLHPSNFFAYYQLYNEYPSLPCGQSGALFDVSHYQDAWRFFEQRIASCPEEYRVKFLECYAAPIKNKLSYL